MNLLKKILVLSALTCIVAHPGLANVIKPNPVRTYGQTQQKIIPSTPSASKTNVFGELLRPSGMLLSALVLAIPALAFTAKPAASLPRYPNQSQQTYQHPSENWRHFKFNRSNRHLYLPSLQNRSIHGHQVVGYRVNVRSYDLHGNYQDYYLTPKHTRMILPDYIFSGYQRFEWNVYPIVRRSAYEDLVLIKDLALREAERDTELVFGQGSETIDGLSSMITYALKELYEDEFKDELGYEEGKGIDGGYYYYGDRYYGDSFKHHGGEYSRGGNDVHRKTRSIHRKIRRKVRRMHRY